MNQTKILIVGAGPVGITLACELARRNISFRLIERSAVPPHGSRAKGVQPRSLEILDNLGIAEDLMIEGHTDLSFKKYNGSQLIGESPRPTFQREDTRYPKTLLLPQYKVEDALRQKLTTLGGQIEWATELAEFTQKGKSIVCRLENPNWTEEVTCEYMVACDGGKSSTRKKLGINFIGETHHEEQLWVGDVELEGLKPDAWYNWMSPTLGLALALFPFKNSKSWQLQAVITPDKDGNIPTPSLDGFNKLLKERTQMEDVTLTASTWQSIYRVNIRRAARYRVGNAFIAGDACHVHSIAGGMGMNTGIQDAYNLGWKLAAVIKGEANDSLLDTYGEERIPIADWLLKVTSDRQKALMNATTSGKGGMEKLASSDGTQLNLNYRDSSLTILSKTTENNLIAGDRAPDAQLADGRWFSEQLKGIEWKLLVFNLEVDSRRSLKIINADDNAVIKAYGLNSGVVLVRPDGYIALITSDMNDVNGYFDQINYL